MQEKGQAKGLIDEEERSCTDHFCCCVFLLFVVAMIGVSGWAIANGTPENFLVKFDSDGN